MKRWHRSSLAAALLLLPALAARAEPRWLRVGFVDADTATRAGIAWADDAQGGDIVQWGLTAGVLNRTALATREEVPQIGLFRNAVLEDLRSDTKIFYRVGGPGNWSATHSFWTGPADACEPVRFVAMGDGRGAREGVSEMFPALLARALEDNPAFLLNTGDMVREGEQPEDWVSWFDATAGLLHSVPHMPAVGNHDDGPGRGAEALYNRVFQLPNNGAAGAEDSYFFTYGLVAVAVLNSPLFRAEPGDAEAHTQAAWLERMFTEHPRPWKIAVLHHPVLSSQGAFGIGHPPDERRQNDALVPVFDRVHVDLVLQGHAHWYERFGPARGAEAPSQPSPVEDPAQGTVYLTTGGAGAPTLPCWLVLSPAEGSAVCASDYHYTLIDVEPDRIRIRARAAGQPGRILDDVTWNKTPPRGLCESADPAGSSRGGAP